MFVIFIGMTNRLNVSFLPVLYVLFIGVLVRIFQPIEDPKSVYVDKVENKVVIGKMANNRNLAFGAKNIFQEILQDKDFVIVEDREKADLVFSAEILFFDVNKTKTNISVFHSDKEETLVVMKGRLTTKEGKKIKDKIIYRSGNFSKLSENDITIFNSLNIFLVISFRQVPKSDLLNFLF